MCIFCGHDNVMCTLLLATCISLYHRQSFIIISFFYWNLIIKIIKSYFVISHDIPASHMSALFEIHQVSTGIHSSFRHDFPTIYTHHKLCILYDYRFQCKRDLLNFSWKCYRLFKTIKSHWTKFRHVCTRCIFHVNWINGYEM